MVLVDSSHEESRQVVHGSFPWWIRFFLAVEVPLLVVETRKARGGADRRSIVRELRSSNRLTAADKPLAEGALGDKPLIVLTAPVSGRALAESWRRMHGLHEDLARLSVNSRHIVSGQPGHYIHKREPDLVLAAIQDVLRSARTHTPLAQLTLPEPSAGQ